MIYFSAVLKMKGYSIFYGKWFG